MQPSLNINCEKYSNQDICKVWYFLAVCVTAVYMKLSDVTTIMFVDSQKPLKYNCDKLYCKKRESNFRNFAKQWKTRKICNYMQFRTLQWAFDNGRDLKVVHSYHQTPGYPRGASHVTSPVSWLLASSYKAWFLRAAGCGGNSADSR